MEASKGRPFFRSVSMALLLGIFLPQLAQSFDYDWQLMPFNNLSSYIYTRPAYQSSFDKLIPLPSTSPSYAIKLLPGGAYYPPVKTSYQTQGMVFNQDTWGEYSSLNKFLTMYDNDLGYPAYSWSHYLTPGSGNDIYRFSSTNLSWMGWPSYQGLEKTYQAYLQPFHYPYTSFSLNAYQFPYFSYRRPPSQSKPSEPQPEDHETMGLMLLIEYEGMEGLANFVYELQRREIPSLLLTSTSFMVEHCEEIRTLTNYGLEVGALSSPSPPFWDMPYEDQYQIMAGVKNTIETCLGKPVRVIASKYFAYDENTVKAAEALGIPYVLARGTTGAKATIYKPEEYNVKIFSVSNVSSESWGTGSLCDYSYWAREGSPAQFREEMFDALQHDKISPVSHTRIGGLKAAWYSVYMDFFDQAEVTWADLDTFGHTDITLPLAEIPQNREVQYTTPKPLIPLEEETDVDNPCAIYDFPPSGGEGSHVGERLLIFHNGTGPMCLEALAFLETIQYTIEEHLISEAGFYNSLNALITEFGTSEGVSQSFGYYPIIFIRDRAFSGFHDSIRDEILSLM